MVLVGLGGLEGSSTAEQLVRPLGLVRAVYDLIVGLGLVGVIFRFVR